LLESDVDLLDRFEALLKNIVDGGILSHLARTVQPAEIARRLATEMEFNYGKGFVGPTGRIAPNDFTVRLSPEDYKEYEPNREALEAYLARYLDDVAAREGMTLLGPSAVHLAADQRQARHTLGIDSRVAGRPPAPAAPPADVTVLGVENTGVRQPSAQPARPRTSGAGVLVDLTSGARVPLGDRTVKLGRALENTLVASNEYVSRAHAEIRPRDGRYYLRDLGSRNGTFLNGKKLSAERELAADDTITLGPEPVGQRYRFERAEAGG
jgi:FHA domain-containing protein